MFVYNSNDTIFAFITQFFHFGQGILVFLWQELNWIQSAIDENKQKNMMKRYDRIVIRNIYSPWPQELAIHFNATTRVVYMEY